MSIRWRQILLVLVTAPVCVFFLPAATSVAQSTSPRWSPAQTIPGYGEETNPPILIADQNNTVHAFASQSVGEESDLLAITYNQWSQVQGWTEPIDVLLSPAKQQARLLDVLLDRDGVFHVIFFGGDETESYLYHSRAAAVDAADSRSWSPPEPIAGSMTPPSGAIIEDADGDLTVLHGGQQDGTGIYMSYSDDQGNNWSEPTPIGLTNSNKLFPYNILTVQGSDGSVHAIWQIMNISGQGRGMFYSQYEEEEGRWSSPVDLSLGDEMTELGTMTPALALHNDVLFVLYNVSGKIVMKRSANGGRTWTASEPLFSEHGGVNGSLSLVEDSAKGLHLLFGQRITASPDIHGMWHSQLSGVNNWSYPFPLVSGPQVVDMFGDSGFDPYDASAVVVQGETLLATWRTDPGMNGNGVWYAYHDLDAPALPVEPLPGAMLLAASPATASLVATDDLSLELVAISTPALIENSPLASEGVQTHSSSPATPILFGILPVGLLIAAMLIRTLRVSRQP